MVETRKFATDSHSVNDAIPEIDGTISYDCFETAVADLIQSSPGSLMAKLDLKDAFRHIPVRPADWGLLGFSWEGQFYHMLVLCFGVRSAPYVFNLFAEALHWIIQRHIPARLRHYLDDFLFVFGPETERPICNAAVEWVLGLGEALGLAFSIPKTLWPNPEIEFLGLELDSVRMEARLPTDKLSYLIGLLSDFRGRSRCTRSDAESLVGYLQFCAQVIPCARSFLRRLIDFSKSFPSRFSIRRIPSGARADLHWWLAFASEWNGVCLLRPHCATVDVHMDASGTRGLGGVFRSSWFAVRVARRFHHRDIQFKELYTIYQAFLRWGRAWSGKHLIIHCDNQAVVAWLTSGTARSPHAMPLLRALTLLAARLDVSYSVSWLPSAENALADAASRFQFTRLFQLAPYLDRKPCPADPQIHGMRHTLASPNLSPSSSGMGLHPVLGRRTTLVSGPSATLSLFAPIFYPSPAAGCPPRSLPSWSGQQVSQTATSPCQPSKPTLLPCAPFMLTSGTTSLPPTLSSSSGSFEGSTGSGVRVHDG